ncbi:MAG: hypothetical protein AB8I08_02570 [Sandaracinaceae bacterium]
MSPPSTVAIVEPHYDDAWLSLGGTILSQPEIGFFIVSVSRSPENQQHRTRALESELPNVRTADLALEDLGWNRREVGRRRKEAGVADWRALFDLDNGLTAGELEDRVVAAMPSSIEVVCLPLGLVHPMHDVLSRLALDRPTVRYFEYPYGYFTGWEAALTERTDGRPETRVDIGGVIAKKCALFDALYPEQRGVLSISRCTTRLDAMREERVYGETGSWLSP